jgi:hypothetical protein
MTGRNCDFVALMALEDVGNMDLACDLGNPTISSPMQRMA